MRADEAYQQELEHRRWLDEYTNGEKSMDMTKYAASDSKDLKAADFVGQRLKVKISGVTEVHFEATEKQAAQDRAKLAFEGKEKGLVLNPTNTKTLIEAYGPQSDGWIGHEVGLTTVDYTDKGFGHGWKVTPLDIPEPEFEDSIPF